MEAAEPMEHLGGAGRLRAEWQSSRYSLNAWLSIGSGYAAEVIGRLPYDSVTIDMQHGMLGFETALTMLQAVSAAGSVPMARVPANEAWMIQQVLDAGAYGVICPMISTAGECERFVRSAKYAPDGRRSFGPARGLLSGGKDYVLTANQEILTWAMIETAQAIENLEGIVTVSGLDGIYIGPSDLSMELEGKVSDPLSRRVVEDIHQIILRARARREDLRIGVFCPDTGFALEMAQAGCDLLTIMNDVGLLRLATARVLAEMVAAPQGRRASPDGAAPAEKAGARCIRQRP